MHCIVGIVQVPTFIPVEYKMYYKHDGKVDYVQEYSLDTLVECCMIRQKDLAGVFGIKCSIVPAIF